MCAGIFAAFLFFYIDTQTLILSHQLIQLIKDNPLFSTNFHLADIFNAT